MSESEAFKELSDDLKKFYRKAKRYGLTSWQLEALIKATPECGICQRRPKPGKDLYIDHDHATGAVRGRLCWTCNFRLLGRGLDKAKLHMQAFEYLSSGTDWRSS